MPIFEPGSIRDVIDALHTAPLSSAERALHASLREGIAASKPSDARPSEESPVTEQESLAPAIACCQA